MKRQKRDRRSPPLSNREQRKEKGKDARRAERAFRRRWFVAVAKSPCGCCEVEMLFDSKERALAAFQQAGLGHLAITDDNGTIHDNVDTFYGFWEKPKKGEAPGRGLDYLLGLVAGQKRWP